MNIPSKPERTIYVWLAYAGDWQAAFWSYNLRAEGSEDMQQTKASRRVLDRLPQGLALHVRQQGLALPGPLPGRHEG